MRHYRLNPDYHANAATVNGVNFGPDTIVSGDQWEPFTRQQFPGIAPVLIQTAEAATITTAPPNTPAARQAKRAEPKAVQRGPSGILSTTAMAIDGEREQIEEAEQAVQPKPADAPEPPIQVIQPEHEKREEEAAHEEEVDALELTDINGVGPKSADLLASAGYEDVRAIAEADPTNLLKTVKKAGGKMNLATARSIVKNAKELLE